MFEEIGHHVEKIRRVRYGPLALDVEPGEARELTLREVSDLRRAGRGDARPQQDRKAHAKARTRREKHHKTNSNNRAHS
jgi:23S rRNA pseudouridine2605 synthase